MLCLAALLGTGCAGSSGRPAVAVQGDIVPVHDPAIIRVGRTYHLFATGQQSQKTGLLPWRTSDDLVHWRYRGPAFTSLPGWASAMVSGTRGLWAPDVERSPRRSTPLKHRSG
ncbi:hypothetical protein ETR14_02015 [Sphingosinicella sp. BN140058]|nr:hypothetical protein ETR14_02015 [Sphingosinicella sp. BN140058]